MRLKTFFKGKSLFFIIYFYLSEEHGLLPEQFNNCYLKYLFIIIIIIFYFLFLKTIREVKG